MRDLAEDLSYWVSVALIAIVGIALFKLFAAKTQIKPLAELAAFI